MDNITQSIARPITENRTAYFSNEFDALDEAASLLKKAGFLHHQTSFSSESTYYKFPGRKEVLRLSRHTRTKNGRNIGLDKVAAALTINLNGTRKALRVTDIENRVASAIGYFFLRSSIDK